MGASLDDIARLRKLYNDILWTHKIQEKQADIYSERGYRWRVASIICVAVTGSGLLTGLFSGLYAFQVVSVFLAAASLFVTVYREAMDYEAKSFDCVRAAAEFLSLRDKAEEIACGAKLDAGRISGPIEGLSQLTALYEALCHVAPRTTDEAVARAEKAKANGEFSELELNG